MKYFYLKWKINFDNKEVRGAHKYDRIKVLKFHKFGMLQTFAVKSKPTKLTYNKIRKTVKYYQKTY